MARIIQQTQAGNQILPSDDPDFITEEEMKTEETPEEIPEPQESETPVSQEEPEPKTPLEVVPPKKPRPTQNYTAELARRREREERLSASLKAKDDELAKLIEENRRFKARQDIEREAQERAAKAAREAERPDPETDPYGARLWDIEENLHKQREITQRMEERERREQQQGIVAAAINEVTTYLESDVAQFKTNNKDIDYDAASNHVYRTYMEFWQGVGLNQVEAQAVVANTFLAVGKSAQVRGQSAAQAIHNLAKITGWKGEGQAASVSTVDKGENAQAKIAKIVKAQKLQGLGGKTPSERTLSENLASLSADELAGLSDDQYILYKQDPVLGPLLMKRLEELG